MLVFLKRCYPIIIIAIFQIQALSVFGSAIIGGEDSGTTTPYVALVSPSGVATSLSGATPTGTGVIVSVGINDSGAAIIGGLDNGTIIPYAAIVSPSGFATKVTGATPTGNGEIWSVGINASGAAIIGGQDNNNTDPYAALVSPSGFASALTGAAPTGNGQIYSVGINASGAAIIGGADSGPVNPYVALVSPSGFASTLTGAPPAGIGWVNSVGINDSGAAIIGGNDNGFVPYAAIVSPSGFATKVTGAPPAGIGQVTSVGINDSGAAIIGGQENGNIPYAAIVSPSGFATKVTGATPTGTGQIYSVGINDSGAAIIGGLDNVTIPYVALVSPSGFATPLSGATPIGNGEITSVGINDSGVAIIGGFDASILPNAPYVALVSPSGVATSLSGAIPTGIGKIYSVGIGIGDSILSMVDPKSFGPGNTFADPIFTLSTAVLENHLNRPKEGEPSNATANLTADAQDIIRPAPSCQETPTYVLWGAPFGLYAHHKKANPFPDLRDRSVGGIIGFDYLGWEGFVLGGGGAYAYQNIGYSNNFGKARVNQEFLTLYGAWHQKYIAIQGALWGGLYQMHNTRKTLGFISSTSHVNGWIFSPHVEISSPFQLKDKRFAIEPFVMFDWVNNWQGSVKEHGKSGLNLRIDRHYVSLLRSEVGLHLLQSCQLKKGGLTFEESFSYVNKTPFNTKRMSTYYVGSISTFNLQMFSNRTVNLGAVRFNARFTPCSLKPPYVYLTYQGEFGSNLLSHTVALEVGKRF